MRRKKDQIQSVVCRRNSVVPGENNLEKIKFRRNRNVVTFSINMLIWTIEVVCALLVGDKPFIHLNI